jgi:uncharacterized Zn finger protein
MSYDRVRKGLRIVEEGRVKEHKEKYVEYEVLGDTDTYIVKYYPKTNVYACNCPDYAKAHNYCKHAWATQMYRNRF